MEIHKAYEGSEHSAVKHALLRGYLEKLLFIKGETGTREITYVDCFAGPYKDESEDIQATSPAISLEILNKVHGKLAEHRKQVTFRAIYIEENKARFNRLKAYIESSCPNCVKSFPILGDYATKVDEILRLSGSNSFAFFFIDPFGWTDVGIPRLAPLLRRPNSEFLITFMYEELNRFVTKSHLHRQVTEILGAVREEEYQNFSTMPPLEREKFIVDKYRERIIAAMGADGTQRARSYSAVVKRTDKERTKYHLVYGTRHPRGVIEFAKQSDNAKLVERVVRLQVKHNASSLGSLFTPEEEADLLDDASVDLEEVKRYWLKTLSDQPARFDESRLADMLEDTGWLVIDFERAFMALEAGGKVENLDAGRKRPKHPINFKKGERLRRCV